MKKTIDITNQPKRKIIKRSIIDEPTPKANTNKVKSILVSVNQTIIIIIENNMLVIKKKVKYKKHIIK